MRGLNRYQTTTHIAWRAATARGNRPVAALDAPSCSRMTVAKARRQRGQAR